MNDHLSDIANLELNPEEVRTILRRLAIDEFGGSENSRVRDVAELSGTSPEVIARILIEIRSEHHEDWKRRVEATLDLQRRHIDLLHQSEMKDNPGLEWPSNNHKIQFRPYTEKEKGCIRLAIMVLAISISMIYLIVQTVAG